MLDTRFAGTSSATSPVYNLWQHGCLIRFCDGRTVRSAEKGEAIKQRYAHLGDRFDIAVVGDLITGDLTDALRGPNFTASFSNPTSHVISPFQQVSPPLSMLPHLSPGLSLTRRRTCSIQLLRAPSTSYDLPTKQVSSGS